MMLEIKYSVIIPLYNAEKTIRRCLDSICVQNMEKVEVILVNDGSRDESLSLCREYLKYNNFVLINQKNKGPSFARNVGLKRARGQYVIFVDADDFLVTDFFATIDKHLEENIDILKFNIKYHGNRIDENLFNTSMFPIIDGELALKMFLDEGKVFATPWMYVYKKSLFFENNLFFSESHIHEDFGLIPCLIVKARSVRGISYVGYNYVYNVGSLSTDQSYKAILDRAYDMLVQYDFLYSFSNTNIKNDKIRIQFQHYIRDSLLKKRSRLSNDDLIAFSNELEKRGVI